MSLITINQLKKNYKVFEKKDGISGAVRSLFVRKYRTVEAVKNISFTVEEGDIVGYIGSNGSGKTTTLKMLSGLIRPTSGTVQVGGFIPFERKKEFKKMFAIVMGQKNQLWWDLPAKESFELFRAIYEVDKNEYRRRKDMLVELLEVGDLLDKPVRNLSLGERMKMEMIGSILHNPKVMFLDEPTIGLDIITQQKIREFLKELNKEEKTTIILTSHYMKDIEELCNKLVVINKGEIVFDGNVESMKKSYSNERNIIFTYGGEISAEELSRYGKIIQRKDHEVKIKAGVNDIIRIKKEIVSKYEVNDFRIEDVDIEDAVAKMFLSKNNKLVMDERSHECL